MADTYLEPGMKAPDITLKNADEEPVKLRDFRGKWVVLYFYPKDNTPGCTTEALDFTALKDRFAAEDAVVLGVSPDSCKSHRNFREKKALTVELLSDPDQVAMSAYGVWQMKKMYGREFMGVVRTTYLISPDGNIAHAWPKVKVKGHAEDVLNQLQSLK